MYTNLTNANLTNADLTASNMDGAIITSSTIFQNTEMVYAYPEYKNSKNKSGCFIS